CAIFDPEGRLIAQAAHMPVHLGAMPTAVAATLPLAPLAPGDVVILNDPYLGGTHLPDITMVSPVFLSSIPSPSQGEGQGEGQNEGPLVGFVASRAHQADVGGMSPGSMPLAQELIQEGIIIPPIKLYDRGNLNEGVLALLLRNMRAPDERRGDLDAQLAAQRTGEDRLRETISRYGEQQARTLVTALMDYAERMTRAAIAAVPDGEYEFEDFLDDDGVSDEPVPIRVEVTIDGDSIHCDFTGSSPERPSSVNAVAAVTTSAVYYVVRCLLETIPGGDTVPANDGCFRPVSLTLPECSVVASCPPRAVAAGNVETSQRITDVVLGALAQALPDVIPAASCGSMNNVAIGGWDTQRDRAFAYYETVGGGAGASPTSDGLDAVHTHMTNTMNTPAEALEMTYPFRLLEYSIRRGSGGKGKHRGGDGIVRTWEFLSPASVTLLTERRSIPSWGLNGGNPGTTGRNLLARADVADGFSHPRGGARNDDPSSSSAPPEPDEGLPSKTNTSVQPGDRLTIETPGAGAWGKAP
ncbi:MAG: hydantoinase B/oxoprolinase family protein, partial [Dehalococcoidia bacterium]